MRLPTPTDTTEPVTATAVPVGQKQPLGAVAVPLDASMVTLEIGSAWHVDPESIAVWGLDVSLDKGQTWQHWCTVTRGGGPAFTDGGAQVSTFHVEAPLYGVDPDTGKIIYDCRGGLMRPFLGVLKGTDASPINAAGTVKFK